MKLLVILTCVLALTGCLGTAPTKPDIVNVPIATKCKPITNITEIPVKPVSQAKKDMTLYEKLQLVLSELEQITGQNKELKAALSECTK